MHDFEDQDGFVEVTGREDEGTIEHDGDKDQPTVTHDNDDDDDDEADDGKKAPVQNRYQEYKASDPRVSETLDGLVTHCFLPSFDKAVMFQKFDEYSDSHSWLLPTLKDMAKRCGLPCDADVHEMVRVICVRFCEIVVDEMLEEGEMAQEREDEDNDEENEEGDRSESESEINTEPASKSDTKINSDVDLDSDDSDTDIANIEISASHTRKISKSKPQNSITTRTVRCCHRTSLKSNTHVKSRVKISTKDGTKINTTDERTRSTKPDKVTNSRFEALVKSEATKNESQLVQKDVDAVEEDDEVNAVLLSKVEPWFGATDDEFDDVDSNFISDSNSVFDITDEEKDEDDHGREHEESMEKQPATKTQPKTTESRIDSQDRQQVIIDDLNRKINDNTKHNNETQKMNDNIITNLGQEREEQDRKTTVLKEEAQKIQHFQQLLIDKLYHKIKKDKEYHNSLRTMNERTIQDLKQERAEHIKKIDSLEDTIKTDVQQIQRLDEERSDLVAECQHLDRICRELRGKVARLTEEVQKARKEDETDEAPTKPEDEESTTTTNIDSTSNHK